MGSARRLPIGSRLDVGSCVDTCTLGLKGLGATCCHGGRARRYPGVRPLLTVSVHASCCCPWPCLVGRNALESAASHARPPLCAA